MTNTANKRSSAIDIGLPWRSQLPAPDGAITQPDRQHTAYMYAGIAADTPAPPVIDEAKRDGQMLHMSKWMGS